MKQVFSSIRAGSLTTSTLYLNVFGKSGVSLTESVATIPFPASGTLRNLRVDLGTAPSAGQSRTFVIKKNGVDTAITFSISGTNVSGTDYVNSVAVSAGDTITLKASASASAVNSTTSSISIEFEGDTVNQNVLCGFVGSVGLAGQQWNGLTAESFNSNTSDTGVGTLIPHSTTITALYARVQNAPGSGKSWSLSIYKNGVQQASSVISIADAATTASVTGLSISCSAGDRIEFSHSPSGTPASTAMQWGVLFESATDGESIVPISAVNTLDGATTYYEDFYESDNGLNTTESSAQVFAGRTSYTLKNLYVRLGTATGAAKTRTIRLRKNTADGNLVVAITNGSTGSDTSNSDSIVEADLLDISQVPTSTPANSTYLMAAMTQYIAPAGGGSPGADWPILSQNKFWGWRFTS